MFQEYVLGIITGHLLNLQQHPIFVVHSSFESTAFGREEGRFRDKHQKFQESSQVTVCSASKGEMVCQFYSPDGRSTIPKDEWLILQTAVSGDSLSGPHQWAYVPPDNLPGHLQSSPCMLRNSVFSAKHSASGPKFTLSLCIGVTSDQNCLCVFRRARNFLAGTQGENNTFTLELC